MLLDNGDTWFLQPRPPESIEYGQLQVPSQLQLRGDCRWNDDHIVEMIRVTALSRKLEGHFDDLVPGVGSPIWLMSREDGILRDDKGQTSPTRAPTLICLPQLRIADGIIPAFATGEVSLVLNCGYSLRVIVRQSVAAGRGVIVQRSTKSGKNKILASQFWLEVFVPFKLPCEIP